MIGLLDTLKQYLRGDSPAVTRAGDGYVATQEDPRFKPRASADDMVPQQGPLSGLMDNVRDLLGSRSVSWEASQERQDADRAEVERLIAEKAGQQMPQQVPQAPVNNDVVSGYDLGQASGELNPDTLAYLENTLFPLTRQYGIPDELAAAQWAIEGGRKTTGIQETNPFGLLWEGQLHPYQSLENAVADYDRTLRSIIGYNKGLSEKFAQPEGFNYSDYTPEDLAWTLMFTDLADRRAVEGDPLYGDPSASQYRYEAHSKIPDYTALLTDTPEWRYFSQR